MSERMRPPAGWSMENLGLIAAVRLLSRDGRELLWCDGEWRAGIGGQLHPAPGVPVATTVAEARRVGCAFAARADAEEATDADR